MLEDDGAPLIGFEYRYRDAANFKTSSYVVLEGILSDQERAEIIDRLESGEFFIAEQVGIPALYEVLYEFSGGQTPNDHCWHEFVGFIDSPIVIDDRRIWGSAKGLLSEFRSVVEWDLRLSPHIALA